ncbi:uncharacterized protein METZ01_LOCUS128645 [marine metagenome]|uniref:Uncharacterized protein n=1 Tax=marine metagenome TaxID=408172 RepID=A0A381YGV4_9ZZZZ
MLSGGGELIIAVKYGVCDSLAAEVYLFGGFIGGVMGSDSDHMC